jgi:hypothetical protein
MDIDRIVSIVTAYYEVHPNFALAGLAVILAIAYYKPGLVFRSLLGIAIIVGTAAIFQSLSGTLDTGIQARDTMLEEKRGN